MAYNQEIVHVMLKPDTLASGLRAMPYRNSGIDDAYRVLDSSFAASVFA
jgi:hypothetical protein